MLGLEIGADDYLAKPFSIRELLARVKALFRRAQAQGAPAVGSDGDCPSEDGHAGVLRCGELEIETAIALVERVLENALRHTPSGGTVEVALQAPGEAPR